MEPCLLKSALKHGALRGEVKGGGGRPALESIFQSHHYTKRGAPREDGGAIFGAIGQPTLKKQKIIKVWTGHNPPAGIMLLQLGSASPAGWAQFAAHHYRIRIILRLRFSLPASSRVK